MAREFTHLGDTDFPHLSNIDVWEYRNNFDYSRWEDNGRIMLCNVPWDSEYVNVVDWPDDAARDAYLDASTTVKVDEPTMFQVQPDGTVRVPVPFNTATYSNYLVIDYPVMPTAADPLDGAAPARTRYCYFCEAVEELAPSTTLCRVAVDVWSTYINSVEVSGMMLARGHAPVAEINVDNYLANPYANQRYLTAPDVNYGEFERTPKIKAHIFNRDVWAVISCTAPFTGVWGSKADNDWKVPAEPMYSRYGAPSYWSIACEAAELSAHLQMLRNNAPQAFQSIRAVWFVPKELVSVQREIEFAGVTWKWFGLNAWKSTSVGAWQKSDFGYPEAAQEFAKLYTYPYCRVLAHTDWGDFEVKIEETEGNITVAAQLNLVGPYINISTYVELGGQHTSLNFRVPDPTSMPWAGDALRTLHNLSIPTFAVYLSGSQVNDYATYFDRAQQTTALNNAYASATASNSTANSNAISSAATARDNTLDSARASQLGMTAQSNTSYAAVGSANVFNADLYDNAAEQQAANVAQSMTQSAISLNRELSNNYLSLASSGASSAASGVIAGAAGGPVGAAVGGATALASTAFTAMTVASVATNDQAYMRASNDASNQYLQTMYGGAFAATDPNGFNELFNSFSGGSVSGLVGYAAFRGREQNSQQNTLSRNLNQAQRENARNLVQGGAGRSTDTAGNVVSSGSYDGTAPRSYSNAVSTANATKATADANAGRARATAQSAIANQIKQAALAAPSEYGRFADAQSATTRPLGWVFEVQTQGEGAIMAAASQFARYGYRLDQYWTFDQWQVMQNFTYWECSDVWVVPVKATQDAARAIRSILTAGTTVWREPGIIGKTSIWEN